MVTARSLRMAVLAAAALAMAPRAHAAPPDFSKKVEGRSGGVFDLRGPAHLLLGHDQEAVITLAPPPGVTDDAIVVEANLGSVERTGPAGRKRPRLIFRAPPTRWPQLAILTASAVLPDGRRIVDWLPVALVGQPRIEVKSLPRTAVEVEVAGGRFGPVVTGSDGRANLPVVVPPAVEEATLLVRDDLGNAKAQTIPLHVPPLRRAVLRCPERWEKGGKALLDVVAATRRGAPDGVAPRIIVTGGRTSLARPLAPGWYSVELSGLKGSAPVAVTAVPFDPEVAEDPKAEGLATCSIAPPQARPAPSPPVAAAAPPSPPLPAPHADAQARRDAAPTPVGSVARAPLRRSHADLSLHLGYLTNFGKVSAPLALAEIDVRLPWLRGALALGVSGGLYVNRTSSDGTRGGPLSLDLTAGFVQALVRFRGAAGPLRLSLAAGGGAMFGTLRLGDDQGGTPLAGTLLGPVLSARGDLELPLGPGAVGLCAGWIHSPVDAPAIRGNAGGLHVGLGYRLEL